MSKAGAYALNFFRHSLCLFNACVSTCLAADAAWAWASSPRAEVDTTASWRPRPTPWTALSMPPYRWTPAWSPHWRGGKLIAVPTPTGKLCPAASCPRRGSWSASSRRRTPRSSGRRRRSPVDARLYLKVFEVRHLVMVAPSLAALDAASACSLAGFRRPTCPTFTEDNLYGLSSRSAARPLLFLFLTASLSTTLQLIARLQRWLCWRRQQRAVWAPSLPTTPRSYWRPWPRVAALDEASSSFRLSAASRRRRRARRRSSLIGASVWRLESRGCQREQREKPHGYVTRRFQRLDRTKRR